MLDGADAVMLSGETSVGKYPIETVETMARIIESTEDHGLARMAAIDWQPRTRGGAIAQAAAEVAERVGAKYLVAFTQTGDSARRLSRYRGRDPAARVHPGARSCARSWRCPGASRRSSATPSSTPTRWSARSTSTCCAIGRVEEGDLVVIVAGSPPGIPGSTNALRVHRMGDAINEVAPAYRRALRPPLSTSARSARRAGRHPHASTPRSSSQFDCRHGTSSRSRASQHQPRMSAE